VSDLIPEDISRIKDIVYKGKSDICYFTPRDEIKSLIKIAEAYFSVIENKDRALAHALNRLDIIEWLSKGEFGSAMTQSRIKMALKWKGFES